MLISSREIAVALHRTRKPILWIGLTYLLGAAVGLGMVHAHNSFALSYGDRLIGRASVGDSSLIALNKGFPLRAALFDFAGNLVLGAIPTTVMGMAVVLPFPMAAFRGWIGGIVSVDDRHQSRLRHTPERIYYLGVLLLQLIPYSITGGAGVRLGLGLLLPKGRWGYLDSRRWLTLPLEGVLDVLRVYLLAVPLFLIASLVEFLAR